MLSSRIKSVGRIVAATTVAVAGLVVAVEPSSVTATEPRIVGQNPSCDDEGFNGLAIGGNTANGEYAVPGVPGALVQIENSDGAVFDWRSNFGVDAVIVKGGSAEGVPSAANIYDYADARSDSGLRGPGSIDEPSQISQVEFCYDGREATVFSADTESVFGARGVAIDDIPLTALTANDVVNPNLIAGADLVNDAGTGLRFSGTGLRFSGTGLRFSGTGLRFSGTGLRFSGTGLRFSGTSLRFSGTGLRFSGTGLRFSGTGLRFSGDGVGILVGLRSAGTSLRFSGTGLRFSGDGFAVADVPAYDVALNELQPPEGFTWAEIFDALDQVGVTPSYAGFPAQNVTLGQLLDALAQLESISFDADGDGTPDADAVPPAIVALTEQSLLDLDPDGVVLRNISFVGLLLGATPLSALQLPDGITWCALLDPDNVSCTDDAIGSTTVLDLNLAGLRSDNLPLDEIPLVLEQLDAGSVLFDLLTDDTATNPDDLFVPAEPGDTLASYMLRGLDALNVPWEQLPLRDVDLTPFALGAPVSYTAAWSQVGAQNRTIDVSVPSGFRLVDSQCTVSLGECSITDSGGSIEVAPFGSSGLVEVSVRLTYRPQGLLGTDGAPVGGDVTFSSDGVETQFPIDVNDPWAGLDPSVGTPPPIEPNVLYFGTASGDTVERYDLGLEDVAPGSHVAVRISNLSDDADLVLYRNAGTGLRFSGTGMRFSGTSLRFSGTGLRFSGEESAESVESRESETLEDVPIDATRLVEDVAANRSTTPEAADGFTDPSVDGFEVQVSGFNAASTDYVLRAAVTEFGDACLAGGGSSASVVFPTSYNDEDTLVLFPADRFGSDATGIENALLALDFAYPGGVAVATVETLGADWTEEEGICSVFAANAVAESAAAAVQEWVAEGDKDVDHVVIVGGDDKLPFYRSPDTTLIANEATYASTVGGNNPLTSALATEHFLTDDIYGDDDPWPFLNRLYFTPDRAVGRLVEDASDITGQIQGFIDSNGQIGVTGQVGPVFDDARTFTAGYDFLSDAALEIDAELAEITSNRSTLISDVPGGVSDWTSAGLRSGLAGDDDGASLKVAAIQGHMDQGLLLSAAGDAQGEDPNPAEVAGPDDRDVDGVTIPGLIPDGIEGSVMFTAGCHSGFSQVYANAERTDDWARSLTAGLAAPAAVYLANTGYGYGIDQPIVAYSEQLLVDFADGLEAGGQSTGAALVASKQKYFKSQLEIDPYDEKSQMQLTLYGLPMYSLAGFTPTEGVSTFASALAVAEADESGSLIAETFEDPRTGLQSARVAIGTEFAPTSPPDDATTQFFALSDPTVNGVPAESGFETSDGLPIQPKLTADITSPAPDLVATGAVIESLTTTRVDLNNPTIGRAEVDNTETSRTAESGIAIFPTAFLNVNTEQTADGPRSELVAVPAQYDSTETDEQLLISSLDVSTYYAPVSSPDVVRPQFRNVSASSSGRDVLLRASVFDPEGEGVWATGVKRVLFQYFDGLSWHAVEMFPADVDDFGNGEWSGGLTVPEGGGTNGEFFGRVVDGAGLVGSTANKGFNFEIEGEAPLAVAFVDGPEGDNGWFTGDATVVLKGEGPEDPTSTYEVGGVDGIPTYTAPITVSEEGVTPIWFTGPGADPITVNVPIDTREPTVDLAVPITILTPDQSVEPATIEECSDPIPGSGLRDLDPASDSECLLSEDSYELEVGEETFEFVLSTVTGIDVAGNTATESQSAVVISGEVGEDGFYTTAVILGILGGAASIAKVSLDKGETFVDYEGEVTIDRDAKVVVRIGDDEIGPFVVLVDTADPVITLNPEDPGGNYDFGEEVTVTCSFSDEGSSDLAAAQCGDERFPNEGGPTPDESGSLKLTATIDTTVLGPGQFVVSATDGAGNTTTETYDYEVVDGTAPTVAVDPDPTDQSYDLDQSVTVTCSFGDLESGLGSVSCGDSTGNGVTSLTTTLDTRTPGAKELVVSATDIAGNTTTRKFPYSVTCDPFDDGTKPYGDIVDCNVTINDDRTADISVIMAGPISADAQYRLLLADSPTASGSQVKYADGMTTGKALLDAVASGHTITFTVDLESLGIASGETLYWSAVVQDGVKGKPAAGFLDEAPNGGGFFAKLT